MSDIQLLKHAVRQMLDIWPDPTRIKLTLQLACMDDDDLVSDPSVINAENMMIKINENVATAFRKASAEQVEAIFAECIADRQALAAAETVTDFDRLCEVFNYLAHKGIFCVHNLETTPSSCYELTMNKLDVYKQAKAQGKPLNFDPDQIWAVVFYHFQDVYHAAKTNKLMLSYMAIADGPQEQIDQLKAKVEVMAALALIGLPSEQPCFTTVQRIVVPMRWQRLPLAKVVNLQQDLGKLTLPIVPPELDPLELFQSKLKEYQRNADVVQTVQVLTNLFIHEYIGRNREAARYLQVLRALQSEFIVLIALPPEMREAAKHLRNMVSFAAMVGKPTPAGVDEQVLSMVKLYEEEAAIKIWMEKIVPTYDAAPADVPITQAPRMHR